MSDYSAPVRDMRFVIEEVIGFHEIAALPGHEEVGADLVASILEEAGRFGAGVLAPLNRPGDVQGAAWSAEGVRSPEGFAQAYQAFVEAGWNGVTGDPEHGGMGLPELVVRPDREAMESEVAGRLAAVGSRGSPCRSSPPCVRAIVGP